MAYAKNAFCIVSYVGLNFIRLTARQNIVMTNADWKAYELATAVQIIALTTEIHSLITQREPPNVVPNLGRKNDTDTQ